tara:strand:+ start:9457 stop:17598 length:8142 start_codon:yes stop_codon:yes gene_type:complete
MIEYILNGKTVKVSPENEQAFLEANPSAKKKETSWFKGEEGWVPDELEFWKKKEQEDLEPGKDQGASQPQQEETVQSQENQQEDTESLSEDTSSDFVKYKLNNKVVKVAPENVEAFEAENVEATIVNYPKGTILDKITDDSTEVPKDKGYFSDYMLALKQGKRGLTTDGAFEIMRKGEGISDEELKKYIEMVEETSNIGQTDAQIEYNKKVEENGGGAWGHIKVWGQDSPLFWDHALQQVLSSFSTIGHSATSKETLAAVAGGAGAGYATTKSKYGVISGMYSAGIGAMETGLEFTELLKEELVEQGIDPSDFKNGFNEDNIRTLILENPESLERIKKKALARGMSMAMIEAMTFGVARGVGKTVVKKTGSGGAAAVAVTATEMAGGAGSEAVGQFASGGTAEEGGFSVEKGIENMDSGEIFLEGVLEGPGMVLNTDIMLDGFKGRKYTINGGDVTKQRIVSILNDNELSTKDRAKILKNIEIKNDKTLQGLVDEATNDLAIELSIDSQVIDKADRKRLVELEKKRLKAEADSKKTGIFQVPGSSKRLADIEAKIEEIVAPYQNQVDKNLIDVQIQEQQAAEFKADMAERMFKSNLEFAKKHSAIYGLEVDDTLSREQIREKFGDEAADADGWIDNDTNMIYVNTEVAMFTDAVNVGNHELLHGILRKAMKSDPNKFVNIRQELSQQVGKQWAKVEQRVREAGYTEEYMMENPDEWITLTSDAIANGDITYSESVFQPLKDLILPVLRAAGFRKINFNTGKDVFEFLKEYNRSIHKGSLSSGIVSATGGRTQVSGGPKFSKTNLQGMLDRFGITKKDYDQNPAATKSKIKRMVNDTIRKDVNGVEIPYGKFKDNFENDVSSIYSEFGQEISKEGQSITGAIVKRLFTNIPQNIADEAMVTKQSYQADLVSLAGTIMPEYNFSQPVDKFLSTRLNLRANRLASDLGIASVEESSKKTRIDNRFGGEDVQVQIEDKSQQEQSFENDPILEQEIKKQKGVFETKSKGEFVKKNLKFSEDTNKVLIDVYDKTSYDPNSPFEKVKEDMVDQFDPSVKSKNQVRPTGVLYPAFEAVSENEFGVNPNSILAKPQTLTKPESVSSRTKIAQAMDRVGVKKLMQATFPKVNFNPKTGNSLKIKKKILEAFYVDGKQRVPNLYGKALNIDRMSDSDILAAFGINPDFTLMDYNRSYDPAVKGFIEMAASFSFNQTVRETTNQQAAEIGVGKPDIAFSKSVKNSYRKSPADIAKELGINLIPGSSKTRAKNSMYNKTETWAQARDRVVRNFLTKYPEYRLILQKALTGGSKRSMYVSVGEFNEAAGPIPKGVDLTNVTRTAYNEKRRFTEKAFKKFKTEKFKQGEAKKLEILRGFFVAIQEFAQSTKIDGKVNPDMFLFLEMLRDSGAAGQGHIIRILAPVKFYTVNQRTKKPVFNKEVVEEHTDPQNQIGTALLDAAIKGNVKEVFDVIGGSYMQGSLLLEGDNLIANKEKNSKKRDLTRDMPDVYFDDIIPRIKSGKLKLPPGMASVVRMAVQGVNLNELMLIDSNQTIAEFFNVGIDTKNLTDTQIEFLIPYQNELIVNQLRGKITKARAGKSIKENIQNNVVLKSDSDIKAIMDRNKADDNVRQYSKSGEVKGMSTFDFDDTLGYTKSGVRATVPNTDGLPKPNRKVIFLAGGAGSGKSNVIKKLNLEKDGFKIVNSDISLQWLKKNSGLPADMRELTKEQRSKLGKLGHQARGIARRKMMKYQGSANGVVVDGTGGSVNSMRKLVDEFKSKGYDVSMVFVDTSLETALKRNRARSERSLLDTIVKRNNEAVQGNKTEFKKMFGNTFMEVNTDNIAMRDPMPTEFKAKVEDFVYSYEKLRLDAEEFATQGDSILERGGKFDFSEFNNVVDGTPGPLLNKAKARAAKYGTKDMFVLTARPQQSAKAIHGFLKSQGLDIPLKNITGLANSSGNAKAQWMLEKFAEGYNDMYFVDDALQNVEAVKEVLDQLDIKSDVVQAKRKFSKSASQNFNTILEESQGTSRNRTYSQAEARREGQHKGWWRIFVPPSAEDFKGLLYRFLGTGRQGEMHMKYFKVKLLDPFAQGIRNWNNYKQRMVNEYKQLKANMPDVVSRFGYKVGNTGFTVQDAIRVYLWNKSGNKIPGLDQVTQQVLVDFVNQNADVKAFADTLGNISRVKQGYISPGKNWSVSSIAFDLNRVVSKVGRRAFLAEWKSNVDAIFTEENMNKIEALYGTNFKDALVDILFRMENGGNRRISNNKLVNGFTEWINGSIGAIMFFNMRSALLQTMSTVNFINWSDNNLINASAAFANQKQFWEDFSMLFNSSQLKQRRSGIQIDVSASELASAFKDRKATPAAVISWLLEKGFTPTQVADSFAISFGGASFFRNRTNTYIKQGMSEVDAMNKAMLDFQEIAEETQQSSREDLVSMQQASVLGRIILAFQNVTMQYTRLTKKAMSDLMNGRGDTKTNISKILYYGAVQNIIFAALQSALAFVIWGDDEEDIKNKTQRTFNSALDSFLRGTGVYGAIASTIKNTIIQNNIQKNKDWGRDDGRTLLELINLSPPIGSKLRKIYNAIKTEQYNEGVSDAIGWRIENPNLYKWASYIEAATNIPTQRLIKKANNLEEALTSDHLMWQRILMGLGWSGWTIGAKDEELEAAKAEAKATRKERKKEEKKIQKEKEKKDMEAQGMKIVRCSGTNSKKKRCGIYSKYQKENTFRCRYHK